MNRFILLAALSHLVEGPCGMQFRILNLMILFAAASSGAKSDQCADSKYMASLMEAEHIEFPDDPAFNNPGQQKSLDVPINGKRKNIRFSRYPASLQPKKGTVVYLCGGPGAPCVGVRPSHLPKDYDVVTMDYLGVGRNYQVLDPNEMAIDSQAQAVAAVVKSLPDPDVILYGMSFGTSVATATAAKLTNGSLTGQPQLRAVVLEGVVGPAAFEMEEGFSRSAKKVQEYLSVRERDQLKRQYLALIRGLSSENKQMVDFHLTQSLSQGTLRSLELLKDFEEFAGTQRAWFSRKKDHLKNDKTDSDRMFHWKSESRRHFMAAGCQLYRKSNRVQPKIFDLAPVVTLMPPDICECPLVKTPWNSNQYQIKGVPLVYINGEQDPNTPLQGAQAHFDGQTQSSSKVFLKPRLGGHFETYPGYSLDNCLQVIFDSAMAGQIPDLQKRQGEISQKGCQAQPRQESPQKASPQRAPPESGTS